MSEPETWALRAELGQWEAQVSSAVLEVEAVRACRRYSEEAADTAVARLIDVSLIPLDDEVRRAAGGLMPVSLRSLDAIHLATALSVADRLGGVFTYDVRMAEAATAAGLVVLAPT